MDDDNQIKSTATEQQETAEKQPTQNGQTSTNQNTQTDSIIDIIGNGQLIKKTLRAGEEGFQPQRGNIVTINITGKLDNGTIVEQHENYDVQVGDVEVVQGVDMSIPLMTVGELAEISVDSRFGYGSQGLTNEDETKTIPSNAKLLYTVELLNCQDEDDLENVKYTDRQTIGDHKRQRGNFWYDRAEYNLAIQLYRRSLEYLDDTDKYVGGENAKIEEATNDQLQELLETRVKVYNNLAAAQMKISAFDAALLSVENVLRCQPQNVKALFRKGKILEAKGDILQAIPVLQKAAILDPESRAIQQLLSKCIMKSRREARNEKDMYQKMLGQTQKLESKGKHSKLDIDHDSSKSKIWRYLGSILVIVAGVAIYRYRYF